MKTKFLLVALLAAFLGSSVAVAQYEDDAYLTPSQVKKLKEREEKEHLEYLKRKAEKRKKLEEERAARLLQLKKEETYESDLIDYYNRRGKGWEGISSEEMEANLDRLEGEKRPRTNGKYSKRIKRFHSDNTVVLRDADVYIVDDVRYNPWTDSYYGYDDYNNVSINISFGYRPWRDWGYPYPYYRYYGYYYPWYDSYWDFWGYPRHHYWGWGGPYYGYDYWGGYYYRPYRPHYFYDYSYGYDYYGYGGYYSTPKTHSYTGRSGYGSNNNIRGRYSSDGSSLGSRYGQDYGRTLDRYRSGNDPNYNSGRGGVYRNSGRSGATDYNRGSNYGSYENRSRSSYDYYNRSGSSSSSSNSSSVRSSSSGSSNSSSGGGNHNSGSGSGGGRGRR